MDWRSIDFDWNRARAFLVTAEEGSLSAAARALGLSQPTLGRQVSALEDDIGVTLFERDGRGLRLTQSGLELLEHVKSMGDAANRFSMLASGRSQSVEGNVCITATEIMAAYALPPILSELKHQHPAIQIELIASNATQDLRRREADIAIRAFRPTQPDFIAKRLKDITAHLYAASSYLEELGRPSTPAGFSNARFLGFNRSPELLNYLNELGFDLTADNVSMIAESHLVQWELLKLGLGIGFMIEEVGDAEPLVERVPPSGYVGELWLVAHRELRTSLRIRTVFDFLARRLSHS